MRRLISWSHSGGKRSPSVGDSARYFLYLFLQCSDPRQRHTTDGVGVWSRSVSDNDLVVTWTFFVCWLRLWVSGDEKMSKNRGLLCCLSSGSWCLSSRIRSVTLTLALWWDYWHRSTSHSLEGQTGDMHEETVTAFRWRKWLKSSECTLKRSWI